MNPEDARRGIANGVFAFLSDRPVSVIDPAIDMISDKMAAAVRSWMDDHEDEIIETIARKSV